ncbi:MAG: hypothetical protein QXG65_02355 [Thermoplasmata archaeon]
MAAVSAIPDPPAPPIGEPTPFDRATDRFGGLSDGLVLLRPYLLGAVVEEVTGYADALEAHVAGYDARLERLGSSDGRVALVRADHERLRESARQTRWFLGIVRGEDHGGHRQALGQYGRLVVEAVRRHRRDEAELLGEPVPFGKP